MPADADELKAALDEGINIHELVLPVKVNVSKGKVNSLTCLRMKLEGLDSVGRPKPVEIQNSEFEVPCDTLIPAIGQDPQLDFIDLKLLKKKSEIYTTSISGVYIGGDAYRGASTLINAIGDGRKVAEEILKKSGIKLDIPLPSGRQVTKYNQLMINRMVKMPSCEIPETPVEERKNFKLVTKTLSDGDARAEASRCLKCDELCNTCVTVCPNFALFAYYIEPFQLNLPKIAKKNGGYEIQEDEMFQILQSPQILHIADWCNECGNCYTFCPTSDAPYKNKPHLYLNQEAFEKDDNCYLLEYKNGYTNLIYRKDEELYRLIKNQKGYVLKSEGVEIEISSDFQIDKFKIAKHIQEVSLKKAAEMRVIIEGAISLFPATNTQYGNKLNSPFLKGE
jgi:putative selenate reductase